ncbi:hypothetical protein [Streptomyces sp. NE06-03C]|uniref:hypothetical protein n=1 Tax=Streptomyces sp. NE06-03C TaxID=3028694 RepID=UPI0029B746D0|nr:hypothetical protein [Streptomyces sp. NE06-03C]MDX2922722.1 hypothetical protein [Streptomyces sp. NE06-03C]
MKLHKPPILNTHWEGYELGADATHRYLWIWHGYNIRLIAVPLDDPKCMGYDHAWCYPRDPEAVAAAVAAWDPDTQDEPTGWHKRATDPPRQAPRREEDPEHNRPRCRHGCYVESGCRTINCPDEKPNRRRTPALTL